MSPIGDRLGDVRRRHGYTQEQLAERAEVSVSTIRKLERGERDNARLPTLHALARALGVQTSALFDDAPVPEPADDGDDARALDLMPLRSALTPMSTAPPDIEPDIGYLSGILTDASRATQEGAYGQALPVLPGLITGARAAGDDAGNILARSLHLAGWLLTQLRAYDLAYYPLREASAHTPEATVTLAWLLIRQGRLDEAEHAATEAADANEPRISRASDQELSTWVFLLLRASAAASRNNRPDEATQALTLAQAGTARIDPERVAGPLPPYGVASRRLVGLKRVENAMVAGNPHRALRLADKVPARRGHVSLANHNRYRLDVAAAHAATRDYARSFDVLREVRREAPEWITHQRMARQTLQTILGQRSHPLTDEHRELADALKLG